MSADYWSEMHELGHADTTALHPRGHEERRLTCVEQVGRERFPGNHSVVIDTGGSRLLRAVSG